MSQELRLAATELAGGFIHWSVERMTVDGGSACIDPNRRRLAERCDHFIEQARAADTGLHDFRSVRRSVPTVHTSTGEVDAESDPFRLETQSPGVSPSQQPYAKARVEGSG